jgi:hypothetical protein
MDAGTPYQHRQVIRVLLCFLPLQVNDKKVLLELEVGLDPQVSLTKRNEGRDVLNLVGIHML